MKLPSIRVLFLDGLALVLLYMLFLSPDLPKEAHLGVWGNLIILAAIWGALYAWVKVRKVANDTRSLGEQLAGISFFFMVVVAAFFFWRLHQLGWQTSLADHHTRAIGRNVVMMLIGFYIVRYIITQQHRALLGTGGEAMEDERDSEISVRAGAHSHLFLIFAIIVLIVQLGFGGNVFEQYATPVNIAHWLIGILTLSCVVEYGSAMWQYHHINAE